MKKSLLLVSLALITFMGLLIVSIKEPIMPIAQETLFSPRIFAYKDWQSLGLQLHKDEQLHIQAAGTWLYTPDHYHGPEGSPRYRAPGFYPLPHVASGALIGRIGKDGEPFYVGRAVTRQVDKPGLLYLRIDDDILSDNDGWVRVDITVSNE